MNPIFYRNFTGAEFGESKGKKGDEKINPDSIFFDDYNQARNAAIEWLEQRGFKAEKKLWVNLETLKEIRLVCKLTTEKLAFELNSMREVALT
jgi:hypothetical protein